MASSDDGHSTGVWVQSQAEQVPLSIVPLDSFDKNAIYQEYLLNNYGKLRNGFVVRVSSPKAVIPFTFSIDEHKIEIFNLQYQKVLIVLVKTSNSEDDTDDKANSEISETERTIFLCNSNGKLVMKMDTTYGNFYKNQVTHIQTPVGIRLGKIERQRSFIRNKYCAFEDSEPDVSSISIVAQDTKVDDDDDNYSFDNNQNPYKDKISKKVLSEVKRTFDVIDNHKNILVGIITDGFRVNHTEVCKKTMDQKEIYCCLDSSLSLNKLVLLLSSIIVKYFNRDIC